MIYRKLNTVDIAELNGYSYTLTNKLLYTSNIYQKGFAVDLNKLRVRVEFETEKQDIEKRLKIKLKTYG